MSMETNVQIKALGPLEIKNEERGEVEAVICTLNVVDHDREVILSGAIKDGSRVKLSSYGHSAVFGDAPVGKGTVHVERDRAMLKGQFFLSTQRGREAFETVKALGSDNEWSIGFVPTKLGVMTKEWSEKGASRLLEAIDLFECSPVLRGASPSTGTVAVKEAVKEGVKEAVKEVDEETKAEEATAGAKREEEAHRHSADLAAAETVKKDAERAAAAETEAIEAKRLEDELRVKQEQEQAALKAKTAEAMEEFHRVQLTLKRLGVQS